MILLKKLSIIILILCSLICFTGCTKNNNEDLHAKVISELDYVNVKTVGILNKLNNISYENYSIVSQQIKLSEEEKQSQSTGGSQGANSGGSSQGGSGGSSDNKGSEEKQEEEGESQDAVNTTTMVNNTELDKNRNDIDWAQIKKDIEILEESWSIIVLDLYSLNVNNNTILEFSNKLNSTMIAVKNEDKTQSLIALAGLYSYIPTFLEQMNADKNIQKIRQTQSNVINAYILAEDMENTVINDHLKKAISIYSEIMSDIDYTKDKTAKTNKIYVLLNELTNSIDEKDTEVFYIKYKNFMKEIEAI